MSRDKVKEMAIIALKAMESHKGSDYYAALESLSGFDIDSISEFIATNMAVYGLSTAEVHRFSDSALDLFLAGLAIGRHVNRKGIN